MTTRPNIREMVLMSAPIILLFMGAKWLQVRSIKPAPLTVESTTVTSVSAQRALDEIYLPAGQITVPGFAKLLPTAPLYQKRLDRKVTVVLDCKGKRPSWWGEDGSASGFLKSTSSQLAWNVNNDITFRRKGKKVLYSESDRTVGIMMSGNPHYDAALDRYVACFYFASKCVPSPDGQVEFAADFWPNDASPPAKTVVSIKVK